MIQDSDKQFFLEQANNIPDWKNLSTNDLINLYIRYEDSQSAQYYLSAIICKYWNYVLQYYYKNIKSVTFQDCYDWLINSILTTLKYRRWLDPNSSLYNDPNGPDKCIRICLKSSMQGFYQYSNWDKRKINYTLESTDKLYDEAGYEPIDPFTAVDELYSTPTLLIQRYYNKKNFLCLFIIQCILLQSIGTTDENNLIKRVMKSVREIDYNFCYILAQKYKLNLDVLLSENKLIQQLSRYKLHLRISKSLKIIQADIIKLIGDN